MNEQFSALRMDGKAILITGGGSGIGRGCAELMASVGGRLFLVGLDEQPLLDTKAAIEAAGGVCEVLQADLSLEENCKAAVEGCVGAFGRLDAVINSVGTTGSHKTLADEFDTANYEKVMNVDFTSLFMTIKYAYPYCEQAGGGSIINIASLAAMRATGPVVYTAAKGAVQSVSRVLAKRFGPMKIRVNTIYPGFIVTEMTRALLEHPELVREREEESPLGLLGKPEDIAWCALYLASDAARFVTGQDFVIDGGATCD